MMPTVMDYLSQDQTFFLHYNVIQGTLHMPQYHIHDTYEIYYLLSGARDYFINDKIFSIKKGDLVLIPKYVLHRTIDVGAPSHERVVLNLKDELLERYASPSINLLFPFQQSRYKVSLNVSGQNYVENLFHRMLTEIKEKQNGFELCLKTLTIQFLVFIHRCLEEQEWQNDSFTTPLQDKISDIIAYINENYEKPLKLSSISDRFFISAGYLSRIFKEVSGFSITEYVNMVRIKQAQKLLRETKLKVLNVAEQAGFDNIAHFERVFKQITRSTPRQYRDVCRGKANGIAPIDSPAIERTIG